MPLLSPNLDNRTWEQMLDEARERIAQRSPDWTDRSPGDPGMVLLELFAYLTEGMIYQLNRVPQKVYIELLNLLGVHRQPPAAARVTLRFSRTPGAIPLDRPIDIPRGTRITVSRSSGGDAPVFATAGAATIPAGAPAVEVLAYHSELVAAEEIGSASGLPGQAFTVARPPIIAPTGDGADLIVAVEEPDVPAERIRALRHAGRTYRVWREVEHFSEPGEDPFVYGADRMEGTITFAPAAHLLRDGQLAEEAQALAAIPAKGRAIRVWYRRGGGPEGNVAAGTLTTLKDPIAGVEVTNPAPATGGRAAEPLENALLRGPYQFRSLQRAVTARDFEEIALRQGSGVARARAFTRATLWAFAQPGTVEVLLVPDLPDDLRRPGGVTAAALRERETAEARAAVLAALNERRPLGTTCLVNWARYKTVRVQARIVVVREEAIPDVRERVLARLYETINPLPTAGQTAGWTFGRPLRASHVYDIALAEPGVRWVDRVRLVVDEAPEATIVTLAADPLARSDDETQRVTWYAGGGARLFRSLNDGAGWEVIGSFSNEAVQVVRPHPERAGLLALATRLADNTGSRIYLSRSSGEIWDRTPFQINNQVEDLAWTLRDGAPVLLLATNKGLYELAVSAGSGPVPLLVERNDQDLGFWAVAAVTDLQGVVTVAVAAYETKGIYLSSDGGRSGTFRAVGLQNEDIRELAVQADNGRFFLWAAAASPGDAPGKGAFRRELRGREDDPAGWRAFGKEWRGGSCRSLTFQGAYVLAGTHRAGLQRLDSAQPDPAWSLPNINCGLPLRERESRREFAPVDAVAAHPTANLLLAGGAQGVYSSRDRGDTYRSASDKVFSEAVMLPETWLFVSGEHEISVVAEDEANRD